ncbi:autophagy-related protein 13-like isoform X2 [Antedon mediterranea]|uniref:autophagy-related protein 13-like isoform X2 n=1 Tax=Antedon mediterranea TaxID=105859 RepID=UPI003AF87D1D
MAQSILTDKEIKGLDQFTKFFALKCIQVIVQARLGEKVNTRSGSTSSRSDWFNLSVIDKAGVQAEARKQLNNRLPQIDEPLCIEISLKTSEGDSMILETWKLAMTEKSDPSVRIYYKVYNRMSLLLKSLICLARTTPAYRVSRHQSPDDYKIFYRIYFGEPNNSLLGEDYKSIQVGSVLTPVGSLVLSASYRTNLTLTTQRSLQRSNSNPMKVSDDHYGNPKSTTECRPCTSAKNRQTEVFVPAQDSYSEYITDFSTSPPDKLNYDLYDMSSRPITNPLTIADLPGTEDAVIEGQSLSGDHKLGAFASLNQSLEISNSQADIPFVSLLSDVHVVESPKHQHVVTDTKQEDLVTVPSTPSMLQKSSESVEDFVMVDLKPAFARSDPTNDFSSFYRDLQSAPDLEMFQNPRSLSETLGEVPKQLAKYEASAGEINEFVERLLQTKEENE